MTLFTFLLHKQNNAHLGAYEHDNNCFRLGWTPFFTHRLRSKQMPIVNYHTQNDAQLGVYERNNDCFKLRWTPFFMHKLLIKQTPIVSYQATFPELDMYLYSLQ